MTMIDKITAKDVASWFPQANPQKIQNLPFVIIGIKQRGHADDAFFIAYAFGTIAAENPKFACEEEERNSVNTPDTRIPFGRYDGILGNTRSSDLRDVQLLRSRHGNPHPADYNADRVDEQLLRSRHGEAPISQYDCERFKGRGFIQLTGKKNYSDMGPRIAQNLLEHPELASRPDLAGRILSEYISQYWPSIRRALLRGDLMSARYWVNGANRGGASLGMAPFMSVFGSVLNSLNAKLHDRVMPYNIRNRARVA